MAGEWQTLSLAEIYDFSSGLSKPRSEFGSGHPFLSFKDVFYNSSVPKQLTELVQSTEQERARCSVMRGDVFLTRTSETMDELGMSSVALADIPCATFNGFTKRLRPKQKIIVPEFARYFFRSSEFRTAVNSMSTMSTRASLNNEMLERLTIRFPEYAEQNAIAHILGTLDDKIELNRRTNETLEAMARTLFKAWFVDFEPVRAKMEGRWQRGQSLPGLPAHLYDIFPDRLVESELGEVPEGWRCSSLGHEVESRGGTIQTGPFGSQLHASDYVLEGTPVVMPKDIDRRRVTIASIAKIHVKDAERLARHRLRNGDIVFSRRGDVERHALIGEREEGWLCGTGCLLIRPGQGWHSSAFLSLALDQPSNRAWLVQHAVGATMPNLNTGILANVPLLISSEAVLLSFADTVNSWIKNMESTENQSEILAQLRNTLLPKLISGELRIHNAEAFLKERGL